MSAARERTQSLWMKTAVMSGARRLGRDLETDVVVVGSGIAGLSAAYELLARGRDVAVIDRGAIGKGMTARTTAHLSAISDDWYAEFISRRGEDMARLFHESHAAAIARIGEIVRQHEIACSFRRLDGVLFAADAKGEDKVEREYDAARRLGIAAKKQRGVPFAHARDMAALHYPGQAAFDPMLYLRGLSSAIAAQGGRLFANTAVATVEEDGEGVKVTTLDGPTITARAAVVATNSPINDLMAIHSKQAPYRTYAIALALAAESLPDALYWDTHEPYHYVRLALGEGGDTHLIVGGEDHKTGEADDGEERFARLEAWSRVLVPQAGRVTHRWSGQVMEPIDYSGFIGRNPGSRNVHVITGDSGQGMTHGALGGVLVAELIANGSHPWEALYDPSRKTLAAAADFVSENATAVKNFAEYVAPGEISSTRELVRGKGAIIRDGFRKLAAFRDDEGKLYKRSAMCTHSGCHVHWNGTERCWDCPCHGSHFAPDGSVLNGPAVKPLPPGGK